MPAKRELIEPKPGDKRYIRRNDCSIAESVDVGTSFSHDVGKHARAVAKPGQGDRGDRAKRS